MAWWLNRTGQPEGPFEDGQLLQMIGSGQLRGGQICQHGHNAWMPIEQHPAFGAALRGGAPAPAYAAPPHPLMHAPVARKKTPVGLIVGLILGVVVLVGATVALVFVRSGGSASAEPSLDPKEAEKRAKAFEASLASLKKIGAADFPLISEDKYTASVPTPNFGGTPDAKNEQLIMYKTDFREGNLEDGTVQHRVLYTDVARRCLEDLEKWKKLKGTKQDVPASLLLGCTDLKYLFAIEVTSLKEPEITSKDSGTVNFTEGVIEGRVAAFSLESGKFLGGYRFTAKSSDKINPYGSDPEVILRHDLTSRLVAALSEGHTKASRAP